MDGGIKKRREIFKMKEIKETDVEPKKGSLGLFNFEQKKTSRLIIFIPALLKSSVILILQYRVNAGSFHYSRGHNRSKKDQVRQTQYNEWVGQPASGRDY